MPRTGPDETEGGIPADDLSLQKTEDGSGTLYSRHFDQTYHSRNGALTESLHVFIGAGFHHRLSGGLTDQGLRILELGLGTGLNALLTLQAWRDIPATERPPLSYAALEPHPLHGPLLEEMGTADDAGADRQDAARIHARPDALVHQVDWGPRGTFIRYRSTWQQFAPNNKQRFDLIYFDAFAPDSQPELWEEARFEEAFALLEPGGVLVTYCAKGAVRRALEAAGFTVERMPGPPGKREMLRATRQAAEDVPIQRFNVRVYGLILRPDMVGDDAAEDCEVLLSDELLGGRPCTKWPGGGLEFGEAPTACLRREAMEEMGQVLTVGPLVHATGGFVRSAWRPEEQVLCQYYLARIGQAEALRTSAVPHDYPPDERQSFRWVSLAGLEREALTFETDREALDALRIHLGFRGAGRGRH